MSRRRSWNWSHCIRPTGTVSRCSSTWPAAARVGHHLVDHARLELRKPMARHDPGKDRHTSRSRWRSRGLLGLIYAIGRSTAEFRGHATTSEMPTAVTQAASTRQTLANDTTA